MSIDFIGCAKIGQWLRGRERVIKTGGTICFAQCLVTADGELIARANATFRVVPKDPQALAEMPVAGFDHEIDEGADLGR